jgi:hypothetical protein
VNHGASPFSITHNDFPAPEMNEIMPLLRIVGKPSENVRKKEKHRSSGFETLACP